MSDLAVIAYLGVPIRAPSGHILGSLSAIDSVPRTWTDDDELTLRDLADVVEDQVGHAISEKRMRQILNTMPQMVWSTLPDGHHDFYNDRWYDFTGVPHGSTDGEGWNGMFHPDDQERAWERWRHSLATGEPYEIEYRLRHRSGQYRWTLGRALPIKDAAGAIARWFGTCTDIHDLKEAEGARDLITRELSHRIQNIFAVVNGLISLSARTQPEARDFAEGVSARVAALAKAHRYVDVEKRPGDKSVRDYDQTLQSLIATVLAPYSQSGRVSMRGVDYAVSLSVASALALILHELATNSVKYGALSQASGSLVVECATTGDDVTLTWLEHGGPLLSETAVGSGFGTRLVASMAKQLTADIERQWLTSGVVVELRVPRSMFGDLLA